MMLLACLLLGGIGRRMAGGSFQQWTGIDTGDVPVRLAWGVMVGVGLLLEAGISAWLPALTVAIGVFLSCSIPIHWRLARWSIGGTAQGRGTNSLLNDASGLTLHGLVGMLLPAIGLMVTHTPGWWLLVLAGLLISPMYEIGWRITGRDGLRWMPARVGLRAGSEFGELMWGGTVGMAAGGAGWLLVSSTG